ncbi:hypothetical protein IHE44_0014853 [Lamprotornis superbus]|uniref:Uncharacterized protein n=1 Tax=Lamprotornis superbus TaxID=245042 RepID=A0A835NZX9_9PASS|nr:hypothetical protein IHE44_0014853 [Lamprotornis superbus]
MGREDVNNFCQGPTNIIKWSFRALSRVRKAVMGIIPTDITGGLYCKSCESCIGCGGSSLAAPAQLSVGLGKAQQLQVALPLPGDIITLKLQKLVYVSRKAKLKHVVTENKEIESCKERKAVVDVAAGASHAGSRKLKTTCTVTIVIQRSGRNFLQLDSFLIKTILCKPYPPFISSPEGSSEVQKKLFQCIVNTKFENHVHSVRLSKYAVNRKRGQVHIVTKTSSHLSSAASRTWAVLALGTLSPSKPCKSPKPAGDNAPRPPAHAQGWVPRAAPLAGSAETVLLLERMMMMSIIQAEEQTGNYKKTFETISGSKLCLKYKQIKHMSEIIESPIVSGLKFPNDKEKWLLESEEQCCDGSCRLLSELGLSCCVMVTRSGHKQFHKPRADFEDGPLPLGLHPHTAVLEDAGAGPSTLALGASCRELFIQHLASMDHILLWKNETEKEQRQQHEAICFNTILQSLQNHLPQIISSICGAQESEMLKTFSLFNIDLAALNEADISFEMKKIKFEYLKKFSVLTASSLEHKTDNFHLFMHVLLSACVLYLKRGFFCCAVPDHAWLAFRLGGAWDCPPCIPGELLEGWNLSSWLATVLVKFFTWHFDCRLTQAGVVEKVESRKVQGLSKAKIFFPSLHENKLLLYPRFSLKLLIYISIVHIFSSLEGKLLMLVEKSFFFYNLRLMKKGLTNGCTCKIWSMQQMTQRSVADTGGSISPGQLTLLIIGPGLQEKISYWIFKWLLFCDTHEDATQRDLFQRVGIDSPWDSTTVSIDEFIKLNAQLQLIICIEKLIQMSLAKLDDESTDPCHISAVHVQMSFYVQTTEWLPGFSGKPNGAGPSLGAPTEQEVGLDLAQAALAKGLTVSSLLQVTEYFYLIKQKVKDLYDLHKESEKSLLKKILTNFKQVSGKENGEPPPENEKSVNKATPTPTQSFTFLINEEEKCKDKTPFLVLLIATRAAELPHRSAIRRSWGSEAAVPGAAIVRLFMLGIDTQGASEDVLRRESEQYHDIIQQDFLDTYNNLTLKTLMGMRWVASYCSGTRFAMKTDTDVFVNTMHLIEKLLRPLPPSTQNYFTGHLMKGHTPIRNKGSKWYISEEEFPGTGYVFSGDLAAKIVNASLMIKYIHLEDVYRFILCWLIFSAVLAECLGALLLRRRAHCMLFLRSSGWSDWSLDVEFRCAEWPFAIRKKKKFNSKDKTKSKPKLFQRQHKKEKDRKWDHEKEQRAVVMEFLTWSKKETSSSDGVVSSSDWSLSRSQVCREEESATSSTGAMLGLLPSLPPSAGRARVAPLAPRHPLSYIGEDPKFFYQFVSFSTTAGWKIRAAVLSTSQRLLRMKQASALSILEERRQICHSPSSMHESWTHGSQSALHKETEHQVESALISYPGDSKSCAKKSEKITLPMKLLTDEILGNNSPQICQLFKLQEMPVVSEIETSRITKGKGKTCINSTGFESNFSVIKQDDYKCISHTKKIIEIEPSNLYDFFPQTTQSEEGDLGVGQYTSVGTLHRPVLSPHRREREVNMYNKNRGDLATYQVKMRHNKEFPPLHYREDMSHNLLVQQNASMDGLQELTNRLFQIKFEILGIHNKIEHLKKLGQFFPSNESLPQHICAFLRSQSSAGEGLLLLKNKVTPHNSGDVKEEKCSISLPVTTFSTFSFPPIPNPHNFLLPPPSCQHSVVCHLLIPSGEGYDECGISAKAALQGPLQQSCSEQLIQHKQGWLKCAMWKINHQYRFVYKPDINSKSPKSGCADCWQTAVGTLSRQDVVLRPMEEAAICTNFQRDQFVDQTFFVTVILRPNAKVKNSPSYLIKQEQSLTQTLVLLRFHGIYGYNEERLCSWTEPALWMPGGLRANSPMSRARDLCARVLVAVGNAVINGYIWQIGGVIKEADRLEKIHKGIKSQ